MRREIVINAAGQETRVAILEDGRLVELMHERADAQRMVGDIYLGRVEAVLPGIQAAFVDIGTEKSGFLHASDAAEREDDEDEEKKNGGGKRGGRYPPIQDLVSRGQELLVQITKEPISTKGPRVTTQVSLPGRFLVYMPASDHVGVSRKIDDRDERSRLRKMARDLLAKKPGGVIVRTVGEELTKKVFKRELATLIATWEKVQEVVKEAQAPALIHEEAKLTSGMVRDLFSDRIDSLTVDSRDLARNEIEEQIHRAYRRKVDLASGGHVVIEATEALVAIDVNTGRYTGKKDPEQTILRTNLDAAAEVSRQLRLRDIGGIIVVDFIDMDDPEFRERVYQSMKSHLGRDRARTKVFGISDLGLLEMSRQRVRPSLFQIMSEPCSYCEGTGRVFSPETVLRRVERAIRRAASAGENRKLTVRIHPDVALYLLEKEPAFIKIMKRECRIDLDFRDDPLMNASEYRLLAAPSDQDVTSRYAVA
jgi:ribonuclease G